MADLSKLPETIRWYGESLANQAQDPVIPELRYTEQDPRLVILRKHATKGQISPALLKRMHTDDLEYLAGFPSFNPTQMRLLEEGENHEWLPDAVAAEVKVVENAHRADRVLRHRSTMWAAIASALVGAAIGGGVVVVIAALDSPPTVTNEVVVPDPSP